MALRLFEASGNASNGNSKLPCCILAVHALGSETSSLNATRVASKKLELRIPKQGGKWKAKSS
jgi:hypothetical protein